MSWSFGGLISLPMVLWHLNATFTFVFLNKSVILRICGEMKVNVALFSCLCVMLCVLSFALSGALIFGIS